MHRAHEQEEPTNRKTICHTTKRDEEASEKCWLSICPLHFSGIFGIHKFCL